MKLLWCCITVAQMMMVSYAAVDVERTVKQVQTLLQANTQLPRLSRDEILQLLNDIRAEDASKTTSASKEDIKEVKTTTPYSTIDNEINPLSQLQDIKENFILNDKDNYISPAVPTTFMETTANTEAPKMIESTTKAAQSTLTVVLPYTPRDGSSLQELYTRPPRVEVVPVHITPKPIKTLKSNDKLQETLKLNAKLAEKQKQDLPAELQAFLDMHGLKGKPGQDHFLLPLDGFKPLPPATVVDGSVQLPENILLTYDLISPSIDSKLKDNGAQSVSSNNFLYEPLRPELPFELDTSSSETKEISLPYDMPKPRKTKSAVNPSPNYEPIDYEAVKVIPLNKGINPIEEIKTSLENDQNKRQAASSTENAETTSTSTTEEPKAASVDSVSADTDMGASIADLEDSFGGAGPELPGDSELPPPRKNGFYWMVDWNSFLEVGDGDTKVNIRFEPKLGDPQMFLPVSVP